jgi:glycosyltransferase involved in cell wall biosynthesis
LSSIPQVTIVVPGRWHAFDLARELEQLGALHRLVTNYPKSQTKRWNIPDRKVVSLTASGVLGRVAFKLGGESFAMRQQFRINDLFARQAARHLGTPDIVHAWSGAAEPALEIARVRGIPSVLERSSSHMLEQCRLLREEYASLGLGWVETPKATVDRELREYQLVDRVFVPSLFVERSFVMQGFPEQRLFRNGFGVDLSRFLPGEKKDDVFRVIHVGALSIRKGVHHLVRAFKEANIPNSELLLVGSALSETSRLVDGADPRIRCIGHIPQADLPVCYRSASVFVLASIEEGQAMVQAQALACGVPLICTTSTGGEDFLELGGEGRELATGLREYPAGFVVSPREPTLLAKALRMIVDSAVRLSSMRAAAVMLARRDLSWRNYAVGNLRHYEAILSSGRKLPATAVSGHLKY